ncbi:MAG TPA: hypothetical protein VET46_16545 [Steroidobacteraceae bacterium]|nr:hypothetical protein [Steroidobacteraceae bacterium]
MAVGAARRFLPDALFAKFEAIRRQVTDAEFFNSPKHQRTKDLWCAAHFARGYEHGIGECAVWFDESGTDSDVDFELEVTGARYPFQTTMVQRPGRRMGDEYKLPMASRPQHRDLSVGASLGPRWVLAGIEKKLHRYSNVSGLSLLVYLNFPAWQQDYRTYRSACGPVTGRFASMWLLNGNAIAMIERHKSLPAFDGWLQVPESSIQP